MAGLKAVSEEVPNPKAGKSRAKSGVVFPYYNLDQSIEVARIVHEEGGGECSREQLAAFLKYSGVRNGGFLARMAAAKMFGLIDYDADGKVKLAERGQSILSPVRETDAADAKVAAFLAVDLFGKVHERYKGQKLPPEVGLRNLLETTYSVVQSRIIPTVTIMMESAEQAGLFKVSGNRTKMIVPGTGKRPPSLKPEGGDGGGGKEEPEKRRGGGGGGGGEGDGSGGGGTGIPAAIVGLLNGLPEAGTSLGQKRRTALIAAFTATVQFIYPESEEE